MFANALALLYEETSTRNSVFTHIIDPWSGELRGRQPGPIRAFDHSVLVGTTTTKAYDVWTGRRVPARWGQKRTRLYWSADDRISAEDATPDGRVEKVWDVRLRGVVLPLSSELLLVHGGRGVVATALDPRDGQTLWTIECESGSWFDVLADREGLIACSDERSRTSAVAYDLSGRRLWSTGVSGCALLPDRVLALEEKKNQFVLLDRRTGRRLTTFPLPEREERAANLGPGPRPDAVVVNRDVIYVGDLGGSVTALTLEGERLWRLNDVTSGDDPAARDRRWADLCLCPYPRRLGSDMPGAA